MRIAQFMPEKPAPMTMTLRRRSSAKTEDAYKTYGIAKTDGAIVVVRPDGYVGVLSRLTASDVVEADLKGCLLEV